MFLLQDPECLQSEETGYLLPKEPTSLKSPWQCSACGKEQPPARAMELVMRSEAQVEKASSEADLRRLLAEMPSRVLHPGHFLAIRLREKLIQLLKKRMTEAAASASEKDEAGVVRRCLEEQGRVAN